MIFWIIIINYIFIIYWVYVSIHELIHILISFQSDSIWKIMIQFQTTNYTSFHKFRIIITIPRNCSRIS